VDGLVIYFDHPKVKVRWLGDVLNALDSVHTSAVAAFSIDKLRWPEPRIVDVRRRGEYGLALDYISTDASLTIKCRSGWFLPRLKSDKRGVFVDVPATPAIILVMFWGLVVGYQKALDMRKTTAELENLRLDIAAKKARVAVERAPQTDRDRMNDPQFEFELQRTSRLFAQSTLRNPAPCQIKVNGLIVYDETPGGPPGGSSGGAPDKQRPTSGGGPSSDKLRKPTTD